MPTDNNPRPSLLASSRSSTQNKIQSINPEFLLCPGQANYVRGTYTISVFPVVKTDYIILVEEVSHDTISWLIGRWVMMDGWMDDG